jgi:hypothetical protein
MSVSVTWVAIHCISDFTPLQGKVLHCSLVQVHGNSSLFPLNSEFLYCFGAKNVALSLYRRLTLDDQCSIPSTFSIKYAGLCAGLKFLNHT